jgi:hypothetical protein
MWNRALVTKQNSYKILRQQYFMLFRRFKSPPLFLKQTIDNHSQKRERNNRMASKLVCILGVTPWTISNEHKLHTHHTLSHRVSIEFLLLTHCNIASLHFHPWTWHIQALDFYQPLGVTLFDSRYCHLKFNLFIVIGIWISVGVVEVETYIENTLRNELIHVISDMKFGFYHTSWHNRTRTVTVDTDTITTSHHA